MAALQPLGFHGDINEFNARVQAVTDAHVQAFGVKPKPDVALHAALVADPTTAATMFHPAQNPILAKSVSALQTFPVLDDSEFVKQMRVESQGDGWDAWLRTNDARVSQLSSDKRWSGQVHGIVLQRNAHDAAVTRSQRATGLSAAEAALEVGHGENVQAAGLADPGWLAKPAEQIALSLAHAPGGVYLLGSGIYKDVAATGSGDFSFSRTRAMGAAIGQGIYQDFRHPGENPGYLFLDLLGFASLGAGGVARVSEAGRLLRAGEGAGAAGKALVTKPPLQRATIQLGDFTEEMPLSSNPLVAAVQKRVLGARQDAAATRIADGPSPLRSILLPGRAQEFVDEHLSFEKKVGREAAARQRVEHVARMALANELDAAAGSAVRQSWILRKLPVSANKGGLTRGEQKAIQVLSWDDADPLQAERDFRQRMIDMKVGDPKAHKRALADLVLAEKVLADPRPKFQQVLALTRDVIAEQQRMKIAELGLAPETAEGRVVKAGQVLRGDTGPAVESAQSAQARLTRLEDEHNRALDQVAAGMFGSIDKAEVARRNVENARAERQRAGRTRSGGLSGASGRKSRLRSTVTAERRADAEKAVEAAITRNPDHPTSRRWRQRTDEIDRLRAELTADEFTLSAPKRLAAERKNPESFYLPTQPRGKVKRGPSQVRGRFAVSAGPYGIPVGRDLQELKHTFEGDAVRAGNIRIDASSLATEAYARTVRAVTVKNEWNKLWEGSSKLPASEFDVPIRDVNAIPNKLREVVAKIDDGDFTQAEADLLPQDMRALIDEMYPDKAKLTAEEMKHVRWIDGRLLGNTEGAPSRTAKATATVFQAFNAPFRFLTLFARPAYALNKLGNHAMLIFDEGFLNSGTNLARAMSIEETDGVQNAATMRSFVGAGKSRSYAPSQVGRVSRSVAEFWNRFADRDERVASLLYYMDRLGYKTPEDRDRLLHDPALSGDLQEAVRRGNKALVEFDNMAAAEKNVLRHIIFVYPWVRGSAVWTLRAVMEHPAKTDLLAQLGRQAIDNDPILDKAVEWYKRIGYFPVGWNHDGMPRVVNLTNINTFSTMEDFLALGKAATVGDKYAAVGDLAGPAINLLVHASTGRDEFGNRYPDGQWAGAARDVLLGLPQLARLKAKTNKPLTPFDIRRRDSLEASLKSALHQTVFSPGWLDGYGGLLAGGLSPKTVNPRAVEERWWADQDPKVRAARELDLLNRALNAQGEFLAKPVPDDVRRSVRDQATISQRYATFQRQSGRQPTAKERANIALDYLAAKGRLAGKDAPVFNAEGPQLYAKAFAHNKPFAKPGPYQTTLDGQQETSFRQWVTDHKIAFDPSAKTVDYDMRGYWLATGGKIPTVHERGGYGWPDTYKTPYDTTFSAESKYATADNPFKWDGDTLVDSRDGSAVFKDGVPARGETAEKLAAQLKPLTDATQISDFSKHLIDKYTGGKAVRQWDEDVRALYAFKADTFNEKTARLHRQGLAPQRVYNVPQDLLYAYGRGYVKFANDVRAAKKKGASPADLRLMTDEHSLPRQDGLPSYAAIAWANQTPKEQTHALRRDAAAGWDTLTALDKRLLGKPVDPAVTEAWRAYQTLTTPEALAKKLPVGGRTLDKDQRVAVVKQIDRYYDLGGKFTRDYLFSRQPLYQRLGYLNLVKNSEHRGAWQELFQRANQLERAVAEKRTNQTDADDAWRDYTAQLPGFYKSERPEFWREIKPILADDPGFLRGLIH